MEMGSPTLSTTGTRVRLNDGSSFGPAEVADWRGHRFFINFYDYNGDGKADHSQADSNSGSDSVYYNTGGSFVSAGRATYPLYTDFSGDGHADNFSRTLHWLDNGQMTADIYIGLGKGDVGTSIGNISFSLPENLTLTNSIRRWMSTATAFPNTPSEEPGLVSCS